VRVFKFSPTIWPEVYEWRATKNGMAAAPKMKSEPFLVPTEDIELLIQSIRGQKVMLDADLARLYGVETKVFNRAVRRNEERFPPDFMFQLTRDEFDNLKSQIGTSSYGHGGRRKLPLAFTENGAVMSANVLNSPQAVRVSVFVVRAFVKMREILGGTRELAAELKKLEATLTARLDVHETAIVQVLQRIMDILNPPRSRPNRRSGRLAFTPAPKTKVASAAKGEGRKDDDLRVANNPQAGQPSGPIGVELLVAHPFLLQFAAQPDGVRGRAVHPSERNRLFLDAHVVFLKDARTR
jgi:ORF6N domain